MRVLVTGATGFIGSAIVQELLGAGHQVIGLARSNKSAQQLREVGAEVHLGTLEDLASLRSGAAKADGIIHTAFIHDFSRYVENCEIDRHAIAALGLALVGTDRPLVVTSGTGLLPSGKLGLESDGPSTDVLPRYASEVAAQTLAAQGVKASVVRLPPSVHGDGDKGFVPMLINLAREKGASAYIGEGSNVWPAVHRLDAARLFRLALEKGEAATYHGVDDTGVPFKEIAGVIGRKLNLAVVSKSAQEVEEHFGWFGMMAGLDNPTSSEWTREQLGWVPTQPGLLADVEGGSYF